MTFGILQHIIGGTDSGFTDGNFNSARFYNPQGVAFQSKNVFFVADTGNHAIRRVSLFSFVESMNMVEYIKNIQI